DGPPPRPSGAGSGNTVKVPLSRLCLARSGDKGDTSNVGVCARSEAIFAWICQGDVERHEVPNILALNFLLHESLGGGGTLSLILDPQGKTYAQYLLAAEVDVDAALLEGIE